MLLSNATPVRWRGAPIPQGASIDPSEQFQLKAPDMAKVAFIGLGVMGFPMAGHLVAKGKHDVTVYNRSAAKAKAWSEKFSGRTAPTPREAAQGQDFVMVCVGNDNDLRSVALGAD